MRKTVLSPEQKREYGEYRDLGFTHTEARWRVLTIEQKAIVKRQDKTAAAARRAHNPRREMLIHKRHAARHHGIEFTITEADLNWPTHCPVLGIKLHYGGNAHRSGHGPRRDAATIDRRDNKRGYVPGNCVIVSYWVNTRKGDATVEQLQQIAEFYSR